MLMFQGLARTGDGKLCVIGLPASTPVPAGFVMAKGLASAGGYLYVVFA